MLQNTVDNAIPVRWQCPIAMKTRTYTLKSDVYSFGVFLYEIFSCGGTPFAELAASEVLMTVASGHRLGVPSQTTPKEIVDLMRRCTQLSVDQRPSMLMVRSAMSERCREIFPASESFQVQDGLVQEGECL